MILTVSKNFIRPHHSVICANHSSALLIINNLLHSEWFFCSSKLKSENESTLKNDVAYSTLTRLPCKGKPFNSFLTVKFCMCLQMTESTVMAPLTMCYVGQQPLLTAHPSFPVLHWMALTEPVSIVPHHQVLGKPVTNCLVGQLRSLVGTGRTKAPNFF